MAMFTTVGEVLQQVDALLPNGYTNEEKRRWLRHAERFVVRDTYCGEVVDFDEFTDETYLGAPEPYNEMYRYYLESMIHLANGEITRFTNAAALWNSTLQALRDALRRTEKPKEGVKALKLV